MSPASRARTRAKPPAADLAVKLAGLELANPVLVASGTFGALMDRVLNVDRIGGVVEKTVTMEPRTGNPHPRVWETAGGMLNSIGLDNYGLEGWIKKRYPEIRGYKCRLVISVSGRTEKEFGDLVRRLDELERVDAFELNISCPNVSHGMDFGSDPSACSRAVSECRRATTRPIFAKLTPNVTDVVPPARAAIESGADGVSLINTLKGLAVDWKRRRPCLGGGTGGLSGPAIKPIALRMVSDVSRALPKVPIIGIGGIMNADDALEFMVAGASAVQLGTANFRDAHSAERVVDDLPARLATAGVTRIADLVGTLGAPGGDAH